MRKLLGTALALILAAGTIGSADPPPAAAATVIDSTTAKLTIWHGYAAGSGQEWAFQTVLASIRPKFPNVRFTVVSKSLDDVYARFEADPRHGPNLFIVPNNRIAAEMRAGLLRDVTTAMQSRAATLTPQARAGARVSGRYYMIPESTKTLAIYHSESRVAVMPATTDALLEAVRGGMKLGFVADSYYAAGFYPAFGGRIVDATYLCVADRTPGVADALAYLRQHVLAGATAYELDQTSEMQADYTGGRLDAIIDGNWFGSDYRNALGSDLRAAPLPPGPVGASRPFVEVEGWFINAKRPNASLATKVALALSDRAAQRTAMNAAVHVPANALVRVTDPLVADFAEAVVIGKAKPRGNAFDAYWVPFRSAVVRVVMRGENATSAVRTACSAMNAANGR
jgi:maltose-binding protein MalE